MRISDFVSVENLSKFVAALPKSTRAVAKISDSICDKIYNSFEEYVKEEHVKPIKGGKIDAISYSDI